MGRSLCRQCHQSLQAIQGEVTRSHRAAEMASGTAVGEARKPKWLQRGTSPDLPSYPLLGGLAP
jgi:hypothetical protein